MFTQTFCSMMLPRVTSLNRCVIERACCLFVYLFFAIHSFSQIQISGTVLFKNNKAPIPYSTVGLLKENTGVNADEKGNFLLTSNIADDTLVISCVGFATVMHPLANFHFDKTHVQFELVQKTTELDEVVISSKVFKTIKKLNEFSNCGNHYLTSNGYQTQLAQHFQSPVSGSMLTEVRICRKSMALISPEKTIFRIRVYAMDSLTKAPSYDLLDNIVEVITSNKTVVVNLAKYKVFVPERDFFVAIEWLKIDQNKEEQRSKDEKGNTIELLTYRPSIGWTKNNIPLGGVWMLDYAGKWSPMILYGKTAAISVGIRY